MTQYYGDITQSGLPNAADANIILQISREQINWDTWDSGVEDGKHIINAVAQTCPPDTPVKVDAATANLVLQIARQVTDPVEYLCNLKPEDKLWVAFTGNNYYSEWFELETDEAEDFTKFKIVTPNYGTTLQTWASDKTTTLQGILMTASPSKPSATTLTDDQQTKTFNSDLLKFNCDGTYNADHGVNTNQVNLRVKAFNNQNVSSIKKYGSEGSTHGYLASGKPWEGANMVYRTTTFNSIVRDDSSKNSIDIEYMYFIKETDEDAKIKFSDSTPLNSTCNLFAE